MKLAVFISKYPARVATFFERDLRGLRVAGAEPTIFPIYLAAVLKSTIRRPSVATSDR